MATNDKISLKHGYTLHFNEDDTLTLKIETEDDILEFDGKNGNLLDASSFEEFDEEYKDTLINMYETTMEFFNDWGVDEETALDICDALTPWWEKYAISEEDAIRKRITELEERIAFRRNGIMRKMHDIEEENKRIVEMRKRIDAYAKYVAELDADIRAYEKTIATLKASLNKSRFISVEPEYTGGGIYVFTGELTDGNFFMADTANYDVRVLNADPNEPTGMDALGITERNIDSVEWQEEHLVKDLNPDEAVEFFKEMLKWVEDNDPSGNYLGSDMDYFKEELENLHGDWR